MVLENGKISPPANSTYTYSTYIYNLIMLLVHHLHYTFDLHLPLPVALIYNNNQTATSAWYVPTVSIQPVQMGDWIGAVAAGASVNFNQISFNPHGNGTHTESVGHITPHFLPLTDIYKQFHHLAQLITVQPLQQENDFVIDAAQLAAAFNPNFPCEALLIRTLPNDNYYKQHHNYSNQNPPYLSKDAAHWLVEHNILHLLIDLPSVDKEKDDGELSAHKIFWD